MTALRSDTGLYEFLSLVLPFCLYNMTMIDLTASSGMTAVSYIMRTSWISVSVVDVQARIASIGASSLSPVAFPTFTVRACLRMRSSVMGSAVAGISNSSSSS
eukprot:COSAG01_NODE_29884_length_627_cov_1.933712_1_plen_102_part_10